MYCTLERLEERAGVDTPREMVLYTREHGDEGEQVGMKIRLGEGNKERRRNDNDKWHAPANTFARKLSVSSSVSFVFSSSWNDSRYLYASTWRTVSLISRASLYLRRCLAHICTCRLACSTPVRYRQRNFNAVCLYGRSSFD